MKQHNEINEIFAGNNIRTPVLKYQSEEKGMPAMIRHDQKVGNLLGIGSIQFAVNVPIEKRNLIKALPVVEAFIAINHD